MSKLNFRKIIIRLFLFLILIIIGFFVTIPLLIMKSQLHKHVNFAKTWKAEDFGLEATHFFVKTNDGLKISAYEVTVEHPKAVIICISGIENPSATIFFGHADFFREHGYATVLFDMRSHGESDGDMICCGFKEYLDTKAIVKYIKENPLYNNVPIVVFGLSMGGVVAINSTGEIPEIKGLISLSAFSSWEDIFYENMVKGSPKILAAIERPFTTLDAMVKFGIKSCHVSPKREIGKLGNRPALLMHTKGDSQVSFNNFKRILSNAPSQVETFTREGDLHFVVLDNKFEEPKKDVEYSEKLMQFLDKNFGNEPK